MPHDLWGAPLISSAGLGFCLHVGVTVPDAYVHTSIVYCTSTTNVEVNVGLRDFRTQTSEYVHVCTYTINVPRDGPFKFDLTKVCVNCIKALDTHKNLLTFSGFLGVGGG